MKVRNVHERTLSADLATVGRLLDSLASEDDQLWPRDRWPAMRFNRSLSVGAAGGHGPIRYVVQSYSPGRAVRFRFTAPPGFNGVHGFELQAQGPDRTRLKHVLEMTATGSALLSWPFIFRPLHDALIEDSLDRAQSACGEEAEGTKWSVWVHMLRWAIGRARRMRTERSRVS